METVITIWRIVLAIFGIVEFIVAWHNAEKGDIGRVIVNCTAVLTTVIYFAHL